MGKAQRDSAFEKRNVLNFCIWCHDIYKYFPISYDVMTCWSQWVFFVLILFLYNLIIVYSLRMWQAYYYAHCNRTFKWLVVTYPVSLNSKIEKKNPKKKQNTKIENNTYVIIFQKNSSLFCHQNLVNANNSLYSSWSVAVHESKKTSLSYSSLWKKNTTLKFYDDNKV